MSDSNKEAKPAPSLFNLPDPGESMPAEKEPEVFEEFSWYWSLAGSGKLNRRVVLGLMAGLLGGVGLLLSRGLKGIAEAEEKDNRVATALFAEGILTVIRTDGSKKRLAGQGSLPLYEGDKLQTGRVSQGYVLFKDGSSLALNANTTLTIRSRKDQKGTVQVIKLLIGEIWAEIGKKTKRFNIETPNALAAVSGTEFGVKVEMGSVTSTLTVGEGAMSFSTIKDGEEPRGDAKGGVLDAAGTDEGKPSLSPEDNQPAEPADADEGGKGFITVEAGFQSVISDREFPVPPYRVNTDRILNWGRSLNARFRPRKAKLQRGGTFRSGRLPLRQDIQPSEPSKSTLPY